MRARGKRRALAAALLIAFALVLTGCDAKVNMFVYATADYYVQELEIRLPDSLRRELEISAAANETAAEDDTWTLADWVRELSRQTSFEYGGIAPDQSDYVISLTWRIPLSELGSSSDGSSTSRTIENYFYFYAVEETEPNPFNGLRADYDAGTEDTLMGAVKNGWESGGTRYPSFTEAFPAAASYDPSDLRLNLYLALNDDIRSTGTWVTVDGVRYCMYERSFDDSTHTIVYRYYAANSLGWNVTAIVIAVAVVAAILLATRKRKKNAAAPNEAAGA